MARTDLKIRNDVEALNLSEVPRDRSDDSSATCRAIGYERIAL